MRNFAKKEIQCWILVGLPQASGREKLRGILREQGIPIKLLQRIIICHSGNILFGKHNGISGERVGNNKGVLHGSPISALLYIIYADNLMGEYKEEIKNKFNSKYIYKIRHIDAENNWAAYCFSEKHSNESAQKDTNWTRLNINPTTKGDNVLLLTIRKYNTKIRMI